MITSICQRVGVTHMSTRGQDKRSFNGRVLFGGLQNTLSCLERLLSSSAETSFWLDSSNTYWQIVCC